MTLIDKACWERGCACYDSRIKDETVEVIRREWVGLTSNEVRTIIEAHTTDDHGYDIWCDTVGVAQAVEAKLKEKNT